MVPLLELRGLSISRGGVNILHDIDWQVQPGEHWVIMGPNGYGKTTLLGAIFTYVDMGAGSLCLAGHQYGNCNWQDIRRIASLASTAVGQRLDPALSAQDIVCTGLSGHLDCFVPPPARERKRARELLCQLGAGHIAKRSWQVLSLGERARTLLPTPQM